jgi:lyso-ornithine lipid O-acyltransferase
MAWRVTCLVLVIVALLPAHLAATWLLGRRDRVPPHFLRLMGRAAGLRVRVEGQPRSGALLLANHLSWLDIFAVAGVSRGVFVAHSGLATNPVLKWFCDQNETVFIARERGAVAGEVRQVREALGERPLVIFPEGTTGDGTALLPFRSSLLSAVEPLAGDVPVQPVALDYRDAAQIAWFGDETGIANLRRVLSRAGPLDVTIHFLPPLTGADLTNRKTIAAAAQRAVAGALPNQP